MLKFIHCADIHLGSRMEAKLPREKVEQRRTELRTTFVRMIEYAKDNGVRAILLSGDVFDSDRPLKRDKTAFYSLVRENPDIDFLYLRGNHDNKESYVEKELPNLKCFDSEWGRYSYGDVDIWGIELCADNALSLYSTLRTDSERTNIVMLHGTVGDGARDGIIDIRSLRNRGIDYLALGHYHSYREGRIDDRGIYAYSGCLEGRGFDETGEKGFVLLELTEEGVRSTFVPFAHRVIRKFVVDISECGELFDVRAVLDRELRYDKRDMLRVELEGEIFFDGDELVEECEEYLYLNCYFVSVKNKTQTGFDLSEYESELSLRGEFVRTVMSSSEYTDEQKRSIITYGLRALAGREVE